MNTNNDRAAWLTGKTGACAIHPAPAAKSWRLVLLGAPGVGKGTQAELLAAKLGACHLSTGDVFRAAKNLAAGDRTPAINAALEFMRRGDLVPDDTVLGMVRERSDCLTCCGGFLLDGFPRTVPQAEGLQTLLAELGAKLDAVLSYDLVLEEILERISGRRVCSQCKASFHVISLKPRVEGICDHCGGRLFQREDDRPEAVRVRMETYDRSTAPLIEFYERKGLLRRVPCGQTPDVTFARSLAILKVPA
jgi:adenylate kinase